MEKGGSYEIALKYAQERGIAETNPSLDVDGMIMHSVANLSWLGYRQQVAHLLFQYS
jgi:homoserine dehydrogenase